MLQFEIVWINILSNFLHMKVKLVRYALTLNQTYDEGIVYCGFNMLCKVIFWNNYDVWYYWNCSSFANTGESEI